MNFSDAIELAVTCIGILSRTTPRAFLGTVIGAFTLAGVCWWVCTNYSRLWNTRYHITVFHHVLCGVAAMATLVFTLTYVALRHTRDLAAITVNSWQRGIQADQAFKSGTFAKAYYAVKGLNLENFADYPPPPTGRRIPLSHEPSRTLYAKTYADEACRDFQRKHSFLSRLIWPETQVPKSAVESDLRRYFERNPGGTYMDTQAIDLAVRLIRGALEPQTQRVVGLSRTAAIFLFLFFQAIPFTVIGYAAYKDLKQQV